MKKLTIADIKALKGKRHLTQVFVFTPEEAAACQEAGIELIVTAGEWLEPVRKAAPDTFITAGMSYGSVFSEYETIEKAFEYLHKGADAIYSYVSLEWTRAMADQGIPVVGHVGLVPHTCSWTGGFKAVGKTADSAADVYRKALEYQDAGAFAIEVEVVPPAVTEELAKRLDITLISMGGGASDVQYLFANDLLGYTNGHIPRHAKVYADLKSEYDRLQKIRIEAFRQFKEETESEVFPPKNTLVDISPDELEKFQSELNI